MVNILSNLKISEVSSVDKGANQGAKILLLKRNERSIGSIFAKEFGIEQDNEMPNEQSANIIGDKLNAMIDAMITAAPSLNRQTAAHFLLHTAPGRRLAEHLNSITKTEKEIPMPQVDIMKLHNIASVREVAKQIIAGGISGISEHNLTSIVMGHAQLNKRVGESDHQSFGRIFAAAENTELRKAFQVVKGMAPVEPASVDDTSTFDDSVEAVQQLKELAKQQGRTFTQVFTDPVNKALAERTYTTAHRPAPRL